MWKIFCTNEALSECQSRAVERVEQIPCNLRNVSACLGPLKLCQYLLTNGVAKKGTETVFWTAEALRKLHGICSTRSTALLWHSDNALFVQEIFHVTE